MDLRLERPYGVSMDVRAMAKVVRAGDIRTRLRALRDGQAAVRLAMTAAAVDLGVLDLLEQPTAVDDLAKRLDVVDLELFRAFVATLVTGGLVRDDHGVLSLTRRGRLVGTDPVVRATYAAFGDFHTGVYRDLGEQLRGGPPRNDVTRRARETIWLTPEPRYSSLGSGSDACPSSPSAASPWIDVGAAWTAGFSALPSFK